MKYKQDLSYWKLLVFRAIKSKPDILVFGKKLQIFGVMTNSKYSEAITSKFRKLEVTFDGDLIDAIRCKYIISAIEKDNLLNKVKINSTYMFQNLSNHFFKL